MLRFRLFGIPFEVAPYFWLISAIFGEGVAHGPNAVLLLAVWVACVFVSIVIHELGHALTARRFGAQPVVRMYALGGLTQFPRGTFTRGQDLLTVLGGPAAGLTLYLVVRVGTRWLLRSSPAAVEFLDRSTPASLAIEQALSFLLFINWTWTLFNLLPILPLDGGLILRNLLGFGRVRLARIISGLCAVGCACWAFRSGWLYGAFFFGFLAFQNLQGLVPRTGGVRG